MSCAGRRRVCLEIGARAEVLAGAREDRDIRARICIEQAECSRESLRRRSIDSIATLGPLDGDDRDPSVVPSKIRS